MITRDIKEYIKLGSNHKSWYESNLKFIKKLFGDDWVIVIWLLAATSQRSTIQSNVTLTLKVLRRIQEGVNILGENDDPDFLPAMVPQVVRAVNFEELGGRKIESFRRAMFGDEQAVVVDMWIAKAFGLKPRIYKGKEYFSVSDKQYSEIEYSIRNYCICIDAYPRDIQAAIWVGIRQKEYGDIGRIMSDTYEQCFRKKLYFNLIYSIPVFKEVYVSSVGKIFVNG